MSLEDDVDSNQEFLFAEDFQSHVHNIPYNSYLTNSYLIVNPLWFSSRLSSSPVPPPPPPPAPPIPVLVADSILKVAASASEVCSITLDTIVPDETCAVTPCKHAFDTNALNRWVSVNHSCPLCRAPCCVSSITAGCVRNELRIHELLTILNTTPLVLPVRRGAFHELLSLMIQFSSDSGICSGSGSGSSICSGMKRVQKPVLDVIQQYQGF